MWLYLLLAETSGVFSGILTTSILNRPIPVVTDRVLISSLCRQPEAMDLILG